jgi:hypothetical protein
VSVCSAPVVGFKAVPSGDVGTNAWSINPDTGKAEKKADAAENEVKALASGRYTMYQVILSHTLPLDSAGFDVEL